MAQMRKYGESKMTRIMMATIPHVTSGLGLRKFQADGFLLTRVYQANTYQHQHSHIQRHQQKFKSKHVTLPEIFCCSDSSASLTA